MSCNGTATYMSTTGVAPNIMLQAMTFFTAMTSCPVDESPEPESTVANESEFHFIIVGGGTSGCALAERLSEISDWKVLLIEAGGDPSYESTIPGFGRTLYGSEYDWKYLTVNDGYAAQALINGSVSWPRAKMIGGCSNINEMIYVKGSYEDYLTWYELGNEEWHPDVVYEYFKKAESLQIQSLLNDSVISATYGKSGPHAVGSFNSTNRNQTLKVLESYNELGITTVDDLNAVNCLGSGIMRTAAVNGTRVSANEAHLRPDVMARSNLKLLKNTLVTKVLINSTLTAYGVEVERDGEKFTYYASREVILSAGAVNSPQLLMLSGVGPQEHLEEFNITCLVNSSMVGKKLQDHLIIPITIYTDPIEAEDEMQKNFEVIEYMAHRKGYLAQGSVADILAFWSANKSATYPDYQVHYQVFHPNSSLAHRLLQLVRLDEVVVNSVVEQNLNQSFHLFYFTLLHPQSYGNISLQSNDPKTYPLIYANYFNDPADLESSVTGIKMITKIVNTTYFQNMNGKLGRMSWPTCDLLELDSEEYWECICKAMTLTVYHPVGTCSMGPDPSTSVVDGRCNVHGVTGLRVIDAGAMPTEISGNTNAPTNMFGERAADLIKEDYNVS